MGFGRTGISDLGGDDLEGIVTLGGVCAREEDARGEYARGEVVA